MTAAVDLRVEVVEQQDKRLGRQLVHDPRSRAFTAALPAEGTPLRSVQHRRYDPRPEPDQPVGCCTGVGEAMMGNAVGNRVRGAVLDMDDALAIYRFATSLDPFPGTYPPEDTGSSGLAAAKAAVRLGYATRYEWFFGLDAILRGLQDGPISFGGWWTWDMFRATADRPVVRPTGGMAGGHQWMLSGHDVPRGVLWGECWWGPRFGRRGRFGITVEDFDTLVRDGGDAHRTYRRVPT